MRSASAAPLTSTTLRSTSGADTLARPHHVNAWQLQAAHSSHSPARQHACHGALLARRRQRCRDEPHTTCAPPSHVTRGTCTAHARARAPGRFAAVRRGMMKFGATSVRLTMSDARLGSIECSSEAATAAPICTPPICVSARGVHVRCADAPRTSRELHFAGAGGAPAPRPRRRENFAIGPAPNTAPSDVAARHRR
jgi:hypothetical protein